MNKSTNRPAIGLVVPAFDKGGLEQVVLNLYYGYRKSGFDCVVFVEGNSSGYMAKRIENPNDVFIFNGNEEDFLRTCLRRNIDILHYHYSAFHLKEMKYMGFFIVYTIHNVYTWMSEAEFSNRIDLIKYADRVIAVSSFVKDYFLARAGHHTLCIEVIPNGVQTADLKPKTRITREEIGLPKYAHLFLNLASSHRAKHQAASIGAAEVLFKSRKDFYIALMGHASDQAYRNEIAALLSTSPARDHVGFVPFVPSDRLYFLYTEVVDCLLMTSLQEGCANVVLEALATGCPMILTDVGNAQEAAQLDKQVVIVPKAYSDILELNSERFVELSRKKDTANIRMIADAMNTMIEHKPRRPSEGELDYRRKAVDAQKMVDAYVAVMENRSSMD
jgi:glycosyltransferase involved in cell wall biosynthesis